MHSLFAASLVLALNALSASASPIAAPQVTPGPLLAERASGASCSFSGSAGASSASKSKTSCATITLNNVAVPSGTTLDLTGLSDGTHVIFEGTTTFGYKEWSGPLISVSGKDITVTGASGNLIDGGGARWWDGEGSNGGKTKPKFFYAHSLTGNSVINGLNIQNTPVQVFSVDSASGLLIEKVTIDNSAGDSEGGHNTDCYDVGSSSDITISGAVCKNQDDCLAINSGTGITFTGGTCSGGHGLSIGSVGGRSDNTVENILIENSSISNSQNGVRIKTVSGATGSVSNVEYKSITLSNITEYGIVIEQDYENGSPTGTPTSGVPISNVTLASVTGSVASSATDIYILCASCSDFDFIGVSITGGKKSTKCEGVPSGVSC